MKTTMIHVVNKKHIIVSVFFFLLFATSYSQDLFLPGDSYFIFELNDKAIEKMKKEEDLYYLKRHRVITAQRSLGVEKIKSSFMKKSDIALLERYLKHHNSTKQKPKGQDEKEKTVADEVILKVLIYNDTFDDECYLIGYKFNEHWFDELPLFSKTSYPAEYTYIDLYETKFCIGYDWAFAKNVPHLNTNFNKKNIAFDKKGSIYNDALLVSAEYKLIIIDGSFELSDFGYNPEKKRKKDLFYHVLAKDQLFIKKYKDEGKGTWDVQPLNLP